MEELKIFGKKINLISTSLANKFFNSLRGENDEPIYTYNVDSMRHFVRKSIKGGRCGIFNQYYISSISDEVFNTISEQLNIQGNKCEVMEKYFEYTYKHRKIIENEYDSQFDDYRDINQEGRTNYINKKLSKLTKHEKLKKLSLNDFMIDFDAASLYPSTMSGDNSV